MTTQRRKYYQWFHATLLALGPIPIIRSLGDIRTQKDYKAEVMQIFRDTNNELVSNKACHRYWKAYRAWYIEEVGPVRIKQGDEISQFTHVMEWNGVGDE